MKAEQYHSDVNRNGEIQSDSHVHTRAGSYRRFRNVIIVTTSVLLGVALPIFLLAGTTRIVAMSSQIYSYGFWRYGVDHRTGITDSELQSAAKQIRDYFNNNSEWLDVRIMGRGGEEYSLYGAREILHMKDVKGLMKLVFHVELYASIIILAIAAGLLILLGNQAWAILGSTVRWSAACSLIVIAIVSLLATVAFDQMFRTFHVISFANDLWLLDPQRDFLLMMFPQGFFFDTPLSIALLTATEFILLERSLAILRRRFSS